MNLIDKIEENVKNICKSQKFKDWIEKEKPSKDDYVFLNNSFVFREDFKTKKSTSYLGFSVENNGGEDFSSIVVAEGINFNSDFKKVSKKSNNLGIVNLKQAVSKEQKNIGRLIFLLVGEIEDRVFGVKINFLNFKKIIFKHSQDSLVIIKNDEIYINKLDDEEGIWAEIIKCSNTSDLTQDEMTSIENSFVKNLSELREKAVLGIKLDGKFTVSNSLLGKFEESLTDQLQNYSRNLAQYKKNSDRIALNDLLRISYNFASDALNLIELMIGIGDLKPIASWLTIFDHFELAEAFRQIPWKRSEIKASFGLYREMIGGARNHAFHNLFSLPCPVEINMKGIKLNATQFRIFSSHNKKKDNLLKYEDDELVEILSRFTRAPEKNISNEFLNRNKLVIEKSHLFLNSMSMSLQSLSR